VGFKIISVVESRLGLFKIAAVCDAIQQFNQLAGYIPIKHILVHTGEAYPHRDCDLYFNDVDLPRPEFFLGVTAAASSFEKTAVISERFSDMLLQERPDVVMVNGNTDSALDSALVTKRIGYLGGRRGKSLVPALARLEAGLKSSNPASPPDVNRVVVDLLADYLFACDEHAIRSLLHDGAAREKIYLIGNVNIDMLLRHRARAMDSSILNDLQLINGSDVKPFVLVAVDLTGAEGVVKLMHLQRALSEFAQQVPVVFPANSAALQCIHDANLEDYFVDHCIEGREPWDGRVRIRLVPPLGYLDFVRLMAAAQVILADSGCLQEESRVFGVPCITLADCISGPATLEGREKLLWETDSNRLPALYCRTDAEFSYPKQLRGCDGRAAQNLVEILLKNVA
jgi:UDP-N-acetylglucosamine 2-epimerase (non-hydrolysing)